MKKQTLLALGILTLAILIALIKGLFLSSTIDNTKSLTYQPMQCVDTPWEKAYKEGKIQFIKEPTPEELILAYYSSLGINISSLVKGEETITCSACEICPRAQAFFLQTSKENTQTLIQEGWTLN